MNPWIRRKDGDEKKKSFSPRFQLAASGSVFPVSCLLAFMILSQKHGARYASRFDRSFNRVAGSGGDSPCHAAMPSFLGRPL